MLFIALVGITTTLMTLAVLPYARAAAVLFFVAGSLFTPGFTLWRAGELWKGDRDDVTNTPVLDLPTVTGGFVSATAAGALGYQQLGQFAFGASLFSWLALESLLLQRLYSGPRIALALRPTLGIHLAPPTLAGVACISVSDGPLGLMPHALLGYALLQWLVLVRLLPWICEQSFTANYWGFAFGATALEGFALRLVERGDGQLVAVLAQFLFIAANGVVVLLAVGTFRLLLGARLLVQPVSAALSDESSGVPATEGRQICSAPTLGHVARVGMKPCRAVGVRLRRGVDR
jgi:tellurite resistance protein